MSPSASAASWYDPTNQSHTVVTAGYGTFSDLVLEATSVPPNTEAPSAPTGLAASNGSPQA